MIPQSPREDAFNRIKRFYSEGDITLQANEEIILQRWIHIDKLLKQRKYTEEQIIDKIRELFSVSVHTARNDIFQTQALMASLITVNKKYLLKNHADNLQLMMERFSKDKSLVHLVPKIAAEYTKAITAIPDDQNKEPIQAPVVIFNVKVGQAVTIAKTYDEAIASMSKRENEKDFTEFEEVDDE